MKHAIEDAADDCMGVKDVDNRIRVQRDPSGNGASSGRSEQSAATSIGGGSQTSVSGMGEGAGGRR
jgi:hypothetical protein